MKTELEGLIEEAKIQAESHPSKDARWFASSVYEYLTTLAQPEQEPCHHRIADIRNEAVKSGYMCMDCGALFGAYTTPPQRTWVGLTDEEVRQICGSVPAMRDAVREAESKLKGKNT